MSQSPDAMKVWMDSMMAYGGAEALKRAPPENAAASVIEAALQKARDDERAAVVAWLRQPMDIPRASIVQHTIDVLADMIQSGEHRRKG